ncbi:hypothetical protein SAY86_021435 [Trapa natans]|uniref:Uncharacterized protein n=1 Tax=Trapa natans TaxID=22666 RepID=A0AAN7MZ42_TRANT|nr:hypothetical protein SAY86_021435 [Trapa natans]
METAGESGVQPAIPDAPNLQPEEDYPSTCQSASPEDGGERITPIDQAEIFRALEVLERDSLAIAGSFTSLFASLRIALSEVSSRVSLLPSFLSLQSSRLTWKLSRMSSNLHMYCLKIKQFLKL